jgi:hypothetical protein
MLTSVKVPGSFRILVLGTLDLPLCECIPTVIFLSVVE